MKRSGVEFCSSSHYEIAKITIASRTELKDNDTVNKKIQHNFQIPFPVQSHNTEVSIHERPFSSELPNLQRKS